jgi:hypothetical protein
MPSGDFMKNAEFHPGITMHRIPVGANVGGLLFTIACILICLVGIPEMRSFAGLAIILGVAVATVLHYVWQ